MCCNFDGITGTIDDDLIHENNKFPSNTIDNFRRWMSINLTGPMYKHLDSRNNIDQVHQTFVLVWSRSKNITRFWKAKKGVDAPLSSLFKNTSATYSETAALNLSLNWVTSRIRIWPGTRPSDCSEGTWSTGVEPANIRPSTKVPNVTATNFWAPKDIWFEIENISDWPIIQRWHLH